MLEPSLKNFENVAVWEEPSHSVKIARIRKTPTLAPPKKVEDAILLRSGNLRKINGFSSSGGT